MMMHGLSMMIHGLSPESPFKISMVTGSPFFVSPACTSECRHFLTTLNSEIFDGKRNLLINRVRTTNSNRWQVSSIFNMWNNIWIREIDVSSTDSVQVRHGENASWDHWLCGLHFIRHISCDLYLSEHITAQYAPEHAISFALAGKSGLLSQLFHWAPKLHRGFRIYKWI